ncbi:MAG: hypothetical protein QG657_4209, partial [Acidobacteriota bacterium]|nr:hypothetical protein [Acidobacteriota bacterium]
MDLEDRIARLSPGQRKILEQKLKQQNIDIKQMPVAKEQKRHAEWALNTAEEKEYYALSTSQKRLYILNLFVDYSIRLVFQVKGNLDRGRLQKTLKELIRRHESLRLSFEERAGEPLQKIHDSVEFEIVYYESGIRPEVVWDRKNADAQTAEEASFLASFLRPFDLSRAPLLRAALIKLSSDRYLLAIFMHHLVLDGVSMRILSGEFIRLYLGEKLPEPRARYRDFAQWQNRLPEREEYKKQEAYWLEVFSDEIPVLNMPTDSPRPVMQNFEGKKTRFEIKEEMLQALKKLALRMDATVYMSLLAVYNTLLSRYTGQEDIIIGTISAGRQLQTIQNMVGVFINPLALRNFPGRDKTFAEFIGELKRNMLEAFENQLYPFGDLLEKVVKKKNFSRNPLFDAMIVFQNIDIGNPEVGGLRFELYAPGGGGDSHAQQDLCLWVEEEEGRIIIDLEYCKALFKKETMEGFTRYFIAILKGAAENPGLTLGEIEMLSQQEKQQVLERFNNTDIPFPVVHMVHRLFEEQAERTPDYIALVGAAPRGCRVCLTYRELNEQSNRLAGLLIEKGVRADTIVGIMLERSVEMIAAVIGVLKSGGAYLPIDPDYPQERIDYILKDSAAMIMIGRAEEWKSGKAEFVFSCLFLASSLPRFFASDSSNLVYIIYTSGTTGKPKGVMAEHRNVIAYLHAFFREFHIDSTDTVIQLASYCFDVFVEEVFPVLSKGGKLVIPGRAEIMEIEGLSRLIAGYRVSLIDCTPLLLNEFDKLHDGAVGSALASVRTFISGGDVLKPGYVENLLKTGRVYNTYGPTESTVCATYYHYTGSGAAGQLTSIPIGKPISNYKIYILDERRTPAPIGVAGELCISGPGIARGYLNHPELTAEKFIHFHHSSFIILHSKLYCTGDLARWLSNGVVEFLGRIDYQVKIRGFRIELEEIEHRLASYKDIKEVVVLAKEDKNENKSLCAYIVPVDEKNNTLFTASDLRAYLIGKLPDYMIPSHFIVISEIPLTANGKIDKKALFALEGGIVTGVEYVPPTNDVEKKLADLWSEILIRERVGINDNFFDLGGQSLKAMRLITRIKEVFNVKIPLTVLFQLGAIKGIAQLIAMQPGSDYSPPSGKFEKKTRRAGQANVNFSVYETSSAQKRLYIINHLLGDSLLYNENRVWNIGGKLEPSRLKKALEQLSLRHEILRTCFVIKDGEVLQKVYDHIDVDFIYTQKETVDPSTGDIEALIEHFLKPYDLAIAPLWKVELVQWQGDRQSILMDFHHIIADGTSMDLIMEELRALYFGKELPEPEVQYVDFAIWQNDFLKDEEIRKQEAFWLKEFEGEIPLLELPTDFPRPREMDIAGSSINFEMDDDLTADVNKLAIRNNTTLYALLLAVFNILLAKYTNQEDIVVGTPVSGRSHREFEDIIGMFVNTLAMRNRPMWGKTFIDFLSEVSKNIFAAFENQDYQFEMLVEKVATDRQLNRNPLFDVVFVLQNYAQNINLSGGYKEEIWIIPYHYKSRISKFDLTLQAFEVDRHILFVMEYRTSLFRSETIERLTRHFLNILHEVMEEPEVLLSDIQVISESEKEQLLNVFNATAVEFPADKIIPQLFIEQVGRTPDYVALVGADLRVCPISLTYRQLNEQSDRLSGLLIEKDVQADSIVGIMIERSIEMIIGILGILKSGGAYLPIAPDYPRERIEYMLKDSGARIMIGRAEERNSGIAEFVFSCFSLASPLPRFLASNSSNLAYIIYTSGSTGRPKAVMVEHRNVVRLVKNSNYVEFRENDRLLQTGALEFDASTFEIWGSLLNGMTLCVAAKDEILNPAKLKDNIRKYDIGTMWLTSPLFNQLVAVDVEIFEGVRNLLVGGDLLSPLHINRVRERFPRLNIINGYGPTENTTFSTAFRIDKEYTQQIPIGRPISNSSAYVVNRASHLAPVGVAGELLVGGEGVSRGYLNNPELTAEKFNRSYKSYRTNILYRTGDLARWLPDGNIEFLGRIDQQVKIRGFRVEPGEIEAELSKYDLVKEAVVIDRESETGEKYLCGYIVPGVGLDLAKLREYLSCRLPDYMIPSYFIPVERIPLTANGKVDRKALPAPGLFIGTSYVAPANEIEEQLTVLWSEVLSIEKDKISVNANFFELGGHSLKAAVLTARIHKKFAVKIPLMDIFRLPTVKELGRYVKESPEVKYAALEPVEKKDYYILSSAQKRLYVLQQMDPHSVVYNIPQVEYLDTVDREKMENIFRSLLNRHESLRTSFEMIDEQPVQRINDEVEFNIEILGGRGQGVESSAFIRPFDLSRAPLLRVGLIKTETEKYALLVDIHHIISDGVSQGILLKEFLALYQGISLPVLRRQYKDYAEWQNSPAHHEELMKQEQYWLKHLSGELPVLTLPYDYPRPEVQSFEGKQKVLYIDPRETSALKALAAREDATPYMMLFAAFYLLLSRLGGQEDIIVGTAVAGRSHADLQQIIGMFVNTLAIRNYPYGEKSVAAFLREIKASTLESFENQDYQFEDLVEKAAVVRNVGRNPLFDVVFTLQNLAEEKETKTGTLTTDVEASTLYGYENRTAKFDITLFAMESGDGFAFTLEYCTRLFKEETIQRFTGYFRNIINSIIENPSQRISDVEMLSQMEKRQLLVDFNDTGEPYPNDKTIPQLFAEQAERTPDHIAVVGAAAAVETLRATSLQITYRELNEQSGRLAGLLIKKGVLAGSIVGIMVERSIEMIIGILGTLKLGGAYLPINPESPKERIDYMLKESGAKMMIGSAEEQKSGRAEFVFSSFFLASSLPRFFASDSSNLAYIIYTSGSTGRPKGVMVEHRNVVRLVKNTNYVEFRENNRLLQTGALEFDASTFEIWGSLLNWMTLCVAAKDEILNPAKLKENIWKYDISTMWLTSPLFNQLVTMDIEIFAGLSNLLVGGDVLSPLHINRVRERLPRLNIINGYGPTENTTFSTTFRIEKKYTLRIPIGKPIANSTTYVADRAGRLSPLGVAGELLVGGDGVSRGYLNNPELTAEKFIHFHHSSFIISSSSNLFTNDQSPMTNNNSSNLPNDQYPMTNDCFYRTGDLVRWLVDGNIEFLGRIDQQVKIRGFRIELGEIEAELLKHELVKEAVVIDRKEDSGEKYLCCYIVSRDDFNLEGLKEYLSGRLPDYMIPAYFIGIENIPLTSNGKLERKALPEPEIKSGKEYEAPANEIEEKLVGVWSEVLDIEKERIGINDNFFQLGGHSLKATILTAKIHKLFDVKIPLTQIFLLPTVRELGQYIKESGEDKYKAVGPVEKKEYYVLSSAQQRLYLLQQMDAGGTGYHVPYAYVLEGELDIMRLDTIFRKLIRRHESLRTSFIMVNEEPVQRIHDEVEFRIEYYDSAPDERCSGQTRIIRSFIRPFDLSFAPLMRVGVIKEAETRHILAVDIHHIVTDGASMELLRNEFTVFYGGGELPPLQVQYKDYACRQNSEEQKEASRKQEIYWLKQFEEEAPALELPLDFPRPAVQSFEGAAIAFEIPGPAAKRLNELAAKAGATLYMTLLAVTTIFLSKIANQEDIVVGSPVAGRGHVDLEPIMGMFVNTLVMRNYPVGGKRFSTFLEEVTQVALDVFENQDYQFENLVEQVMVKRDPGRNPLFDVTFTLQNIQVQPGDTTKTEVFELGVKPYDMEIRTAKFDISLSCLEGHDGLLFTLEYCTKLFKKETIRRFIEYYKNVISAVIERPDRKIADIEILTEAEKLQILDEFNETEASYPTDKTIHELFQNQVERIPDQCALAGAAPRGCPIPGQNQLSYRELNEQSNRLAGLLLEKGVHADSIVGLMMERSIETIIGILGILKSGGAYLPMDPDYPQERIDYMLKDSNAKILINKSEIQNPKFETNPNDQKINVQNKNFEDLMVLNFENLNFEFVSNFDIRVSNFNSSNLAYIIYTSGSAGQPKGVMVKHRNVVNLVYGLKERIYSKYSRNLEVSLVAPFIFDASVKQVFGALLLGYSLYIVPEDVRFDGEKLFKYYMKYAIDISDGTPMHLRLLMESRGGKNLRLNIRRFLIGGEPLALKVVEKLFDLFETHSLKITNVYGPTECCVDTTTYEISKENIELYANLPIGAPMPNQQVYILGKVGNLQPIGVPGELCIGGSSVSRGYLNNTELTAEKFYVSYGSYKTYILYKTGDLARWLPDGNIEFLGRIDQQVKIRGFRIELGEIEAQLLRHDSIKEAVVLDMEGESADKYLCAYIVSKEALDLTGLREYLLRRLPDYMIPAYFTPVERIPFTNRGKVDRKVLQSYKTTLGTGVEYIAPGSDMERQIANSWKEILKLEKVSIHDNFFERGGNSFNIIQLTNRLNKLLGKEIPVVTLFQYPTISALARHLEGNKPKTSLSPAGKAAKDTTDFPFTLKESMDIAVIGMAGRFPGAANIDEFWDNLKAGVESISFFTDEELAEAGVAQELLHDPNYVKASGILEGKEKFDAAFFDYIPAEARLMDPQMRVFHECAWEAFENAGYIPDIYDGSIGVYAGASNSIVWGVKVLFSEEGRATGGFEIGQLIDKDFLATRISYKLNLRGPAISIKTACSTSLVAVHMACRALLTRECDMAVAGGVTLGGADKEGYLFQEGMILSRDGHCRPFDAHAGGTVSGEGIGIVILKRLKEAKTDGDNIYAVVKGSAINNDGFNKVGYTAPSIEGQREVIAKALFLAGVEPETISYVETHGTGTVLGDPIEIKALTLAFASDKRNYCAIGSVKSNMGHLDSAAGVAGFIKTVMVLYHRQIPPSLHFKNPNPAIDFENSPFYVNTQLRPWKSHGYPLRAGVSSFGIGGTNVHVVLEEWHDIERSREEREGREERNYQLILLSAKTSPALVEMRERLADYLKENPVLNLADAAYTLQVGRKAFKRRAILTASSGEDASDILKSADKMQSHLLNEEKQNVVFMFPGQGSQYVDMTRGLYVNEPVFRREMDRCFEILQPITGHDFKKILYPSLEDNRSNITNIIDQTEITQPVIFIVEYALAKLLMAWGINPRAMIGHSIGEYTAACLSGVFSLADALQTICLRGKLMQQLPGGAMLSIPVPEKDLMPLLKGMDNISLAAVNSSLLSVVSGTHEVVETFEKQLGKKGYQSRRLHTSHAFHSAMMDPIVEEFAREVEAVILNKPNIPFLSNVTGTWVAMEDAVDPGYWARHLRQTVRFLDGITELLNDPSSSSIFIEVGPGKVLSTFVRQHADRKNRPHQVVNLVRHPQEDTADDKYLLEKVGQLWLYGITPDWHTFHFVGNRKRIPLPTYPFERREFRLQGNFMDIVNSFSGFQMASKHKRTVEKEQEEDIAAFSKPDWGQRPEISTVYVHPRNITEQTLARIWENFFGIEKIGCNDDFFELGGDSLKAVTLVARIQKELNVRISLPDFFRTATIGELAAYI